MVQLRDGGRYRLRNGRVITLSTRTDVYPWVGSNGETYTESGSYSVMSDENNMDIIAEVPEEKEEPMDMVWVLGKYYTASNGCKARCLCIHDGYAFMHVDDNRGPREAHYIACTDGRCKNGDTAYDITGPWVEPLKIKWEMVPGAFYKMIINDNDGVQIIGDGGMWQYVTNLWMDHIANGWSGHLGETNYRDGRIERSKP